MPIGPAADSRAKRGPAPRVHPERREERDLREHPGDEEEALDVHGVADDVPCRTRRRRRPRAGGGPTGRPCGGAATAHDEPRGDRRRRRAMLRAARLRRARFPGARRLAVAARREPEAELELLVPRPVADRGRRVRVPVGERGRGTRSPGRSSAAPTAPRLRIPSGIRPVNERRPPAEQRRRRRRRACSAARGGAPGSRARSRNSVTSAALRLRRVDREVDGVAPGGADEARERAADEEEERADVHRVAHPGGEEAVEGRRARARSRARRTRRRSTASERRARVHSESQMRCGIASRSRKKTVSRDRSSRSVSSSRTGWGGSDGVGQHAARVRRRVAVGDEEEVARRPAPCSRCRRRRGRAGRAASVPARATRTRRGTRPSPRGRRRSLPSRPAVES